MVRSINTRALPPCNALLPDSLWIRRSAMSVNEKEIRQATRETIALNKGEARCPGAPSTQEIIAKDKVKAPDWVRSESYEFMGDEDISTDRYLEPAFAKEEFD